MNEMKKSNLESIRLKQVKRLQKIMKSEKSYADFLEYAYCPDPVKGYGDSNDPFDESYLDLCEAMLIFKKIRRIDDELIHSQEDK